MSAESESDGDILSKSSTINQQRKATINFQQQQHFLNGFSNGNQQQQQQNASIPSSAYQRKLMENNNVVDTTNGAVNGANGGIDNYSLANRRNSKEKLSFWEEYSSMANRNHVLASGETNELRIDEKSISLHLNNPFLTNTMISSASSSALSSASASSFGRPTTKFVSNNENGIGFDASVENSSRLSRPKRPHSIAAVPSATTSLLLATTNAASTTMTYSSNYAKSGSNSSLSSGTVGTSFANSPNRLTLSTASSRGSGGPEYTLYSTSTVQRRSHSTPRPLQQLPTIAPNPMSNGNEITAISSMSSRPRSLDRTTINSLAFGARPPPIPPSRRFSQPLNNNQNTIKNSPNSVQNPATTSSLAISSTMQRPSTSGMRQSITFHGQLNRHATNSTSVAYGNEASATSNGTTGDFDTLGRRRKIDRPVSFAYGTLPDQAYLENQLRIYSDQLRSITESVRKYSEQAKILSEMKRQQQKPRNLPLDFDSPKKRADGKKNLMQSDSNIYKSKTTTTDAPTPSNQLRQFLDSIRQTMKECEDDTVESDRDEPSRKANNGSPNGGGGISSKTVEAKTPSDQLRQFLDAIRTNQLPEEQQEDLANAADRFSKFKEKMEHSRSKSTPNFDKYRSNVSETFNQVTDNLRIMNEDLAALGDSPRKPNGQHLMQSQKPMPPSANAANYKLNLTNIAAPMIKPTVMDFNQILDNYSHLKNNSHPLDSVDYLRKCSEALRQTSNQLRIATMHNSLTDSGDSSSCSTTPGSIREAVQNLLQQPRNGVQIMDDRMKLFIDILDTQSKFSQVIFTVISFWSFFFVFCFVGKYFLGKFYSRHKLKEMKIL